MNRFYIKTLLPVALSTLDGTALKNFDLDVDVDIKESTYINYAWLLVIEIMLSDVSYAHQNPYTTFTRNPALAMSAI